MAECLGVLLTNRNFIWKEIECQNSEEFEDALGLCQEFAIPKWKYFYWCDTQWEWDAHSGTFSSG